MHGWCILFAVFEEKLVAAGKYYIGDVKATLEEKGISINKVAFKKYLLAVR